MDNLGYLVTGYILTALSLGAYVVSLRRRARRARERAEAVAGARR